MSNPDRTSRDAAVSWHPCRWSEASGVVALLWNVSAAHAKPSLVWKLQRWLKWKRWIPVENYLLARYCTSPLSGHAKRKDRQTGQPKTHDSPDHTKQSGQERSHWRNSLCFMNSGEKTIQNLIDSNLYDPLWDSNKKQCTLLLTQIKKVWPSPIFLPCTPPINNERPLTRFNAKGGQTALSYQNLWVC